MSDIPIEAPPPLPPPGELHKFWADTTVRVTCGIVTVYTVGFVVSNVALGQVDPTGFNFVPIRYVGAALLFGAFTSLPVFFGNRASTFKAVRQPVFAVIWLMLIVTTAGIAAFVSSHISAANVSVHFGATVSYFAVVCFLTFVARISSEAEEFPLIMHMVGGAIFFAAFFGLTIYPLISPNFGGGALWLATLETKQAFHANARITEYLKEPVPLVRYGSETVTVLDCSEASVAQSCGALLLPRDAISLILVHRLVTADDYRADLRRRASARTARKRRPGSAPIITKPATGAPARDSARMPVR
jgi:hypothetical protein